MIVNCHFVLMDNLDRRPLIGTLFFVVAGYRTVSLFRGQDNLAVTESRNIGNGGPFLKL